MRNTFGNHAVIILRRIETLLSKGAIYRDKKVYNILPSS